MNTVTLREVVDADLPIFFEQQRDPVAHHMAAFVPRDPNDRAAFDAAAAMVKLLELLALEGVPLSKVVGGLPAVHIVHETVMTPWEQKGMVMRTLVELSKDREVDLIDGVKVHHDGGWVLALPDPEEPITHIWAEGDSDTAARRLAQEYARRIRQLLR